MKLPQTDLSVILAYRDDEALVGTAARRLIEWLVTLDCSFEIIAVDDDSKDNSNAVVGLLCHEFSQVRMVQAPARGRAWARGVAAARGAKLVFIEPSAAATRPLQPIGAAIIDMDNGAGPTIAVDGFFVLCRCDKALAAVSKHLSPSRGVRRAVEQVAERLARIEHPHAKGVARVLDVGLRFAR